MKNSVADRFFAALALLGLFAPGCSDDGTSATNIAQALSIESKHQTALEKARDAERTRLQRDAQERAQRAAQQQAELDAASRLPANMPADLSEACDRVVDAYDEFMKRGSESDVLKWWDGRRKKLGNHRANCLKTASIEIAACSAHALRETYTTFDGIDREEAARRVVEACVRRVESDIEFRA
jgi:hypothetical protein